jgi:hypothetical protein
MNRLTYMELSVASLKAMHQEQGVVLVELGRWHAKPFIELLDNRVHLRFATAAPVTAKWAMPILIASFLHHFRMKLFHSRLVHLLSYINVTDSNPGWAEEANGKYLFTFL